MKRRTSLPPSAANEPPREKNVRKSLENKPAKPMCMYTSRYLILQYYDPMDKLIWSLFSGRKVPLGIVHHRIDKVATDELIAYNEKINPKIEFKIAR